MTNICQRMPRGNLFMIYTSQLNGIDMRIKAGQVGTFVFFSYTSSGLMVPVSSSLLFLGYQLSCLLSASATISTAATEQRHDLFLNPVVGNGI